MPPWPDVLPHRCFIRAREHSGCAGVVYRIGHALTNVRPLADTHGTSLVEMLKRILVPHQLARHQATCSYFLWPFPWPLLPSSPPVVPPVELPWPFPFPVFPLFPLPLDWPPLPLF